MLCESAGVPYGSNLLINHFQYNDNGKMKEITPFTDALSDFALIAQDGSIQKCEIAGTLSYDQVPQQAKSLNDTEIKIIVEDTKMRFFDWYCKPADEQAYMEYARKIADEKFPTYTNDSYRLEGFSVRISRVDTMVKVFNIAIVIAQVVIYGFVALLLFIGFVRGGGLESIFLPVVVTFPLLLYFLSLHKWVDTKNNSMNIIKS